MNDQSNAVLSVAGATLTFDAPSSAGMPYPVTGALTRITAARELCAPGAVFRHDPLSMFAIVLTHRGHAEVTTKDSRFAHEPRTLIVMRPGERIEERVASGTPWDVSYLLLSGEWAHWCTRVMATSVIAIPLAPQRCGELMEILLDAALSGSRNPWLQMAAVAELFGIIGMGVPGSGENEGLEVRIGRIADEDPAGMLGREQIARKLGLTTRALAHRFQKETGQPLALWLRRRRVERARSLLSQGRTAASVADSLGFANPFHFSRVFKRMTGQSPSEVRAQGFQDRLHSEV